MKRFFLFAVLCLFANPCFGQFVSPLQPTKFRTGQFGRFDTQTTTASLGGGPTFFFILESGPTINTDPVTGISSFEVVVRPASLKRRSGGTTTTTTGPVLFTLLQGPQIRVRNLPSLTLTTSPNVNFTVVPLIATYQVTGTELTPVVDFKNRLRGYVRTFIVSRIGP